MSSTDPQQEFERLGRSLLGSEGILRDRPAIARVRLAELEGDDWGMTLKLEVVPTTGLVRLPSTRFSVSSVWKGAVVSTAQLSSCPYGRWTLYLDPGLVAALCAYAVSLGQTAATDGFEFEVAIERYRSLARFIDEFDYGKQGAVED